MVQDVLLPFISDLTGQFGLFLTHRWLFVITEVKGRFASGCRLWLYPNCFAVTFLKLCLLHTGLSTGHQKQFQTFWLDFDLQVGFLYFYIVSVIMISATIIPGGSRLGLDKDLAVTVLWAVQTKKKIKSLFSKLSSHIWDEKCEGWVSRKKIIQNIGYCHRGSLAYQKVNYC